MITTDTMSHDEMKQKAKRGYLCGECGASLSVAWGGYYGVNSYILRCTNNVEHNGLTKPATINNYDLPGYNMPGMSNRKEKELVTKYGEETSKALVRAAGGNALSTLTEKSATAMINILWPDAVKSQSGRNAIAKAALICRDYGLNPAMDHLFLIPYNKKDKDGNIIGVEWSVVRGIKASRLICGRDKSYGYIDDTPRIMSAAEQTKIYGEVDTESIVAICKLKDKDGNVFTGYGKWPLYRVWKDKKYDNSPQGAEKGNSKFNMACVRAERQALDKLNPGSMPAIDVVDENYVQKPSVVITEAGDKVNVVTGEVQETLKSEEVEGIFEEEAIQSEDSKPARDPASIKNKGDLFAACCKDWPEKFAIKADVLRFMGKEESQIADASLEYSQIAAKLKQ